MKRFNKKRLKKAIKEGKDGEFNLNGIPVTVSTGVDYEEFLKEAAEKEKAEEDK